MKGRKKDMRAHVDGFLMHPERFVLEREGVIVYVADLWF